MSVRGIGRDSLLINPHLVSLALPLSVVVNLRDRSGNEKQKELLLADFGKPLERFLDGEYTLPGHSRCTSTQLWHSMFLGGRRRLEEVTPVSYWAVDKGSATYCKM